jgi:hypothetical protein
MHIEHIIFNTTTVSKLLQWIYVECLRFGLCQQPKRSRLNGLIDQKWIEQWFGPPYMTGCSGLEAVTFVDFQWLGASGHLWAFDIFDYFWTDIYMRKRWSNWLAPAGFLHLSLIIPQGVPCHNVAFFSPGGSLASFLDIPKCALFLLSNAGPNWS